MACLRARERDDALREGNAPLAQPCAYRADAQDRSDADVGIRRADHDCFHWPLQYAPQLRRNTRCAASGKAKASHSRLTLEADEVILERELATFEGPHARSH